MTQEWKAAKQDYQETRGSIQQEELRVVDQSLPASITEARASTSVTPSRRFLRPLPPTPAPLGANPSAVAYPTRECPSHTFSNHIPLPLAPRVVPPDSDSDTDVTQLKADSNVTEPTQMPFHSKLTGIESRNELDRDVGELRSQRVLVPKFSRPTRRLPLLPKATGASGSTSIPMESSEKALFHEASHTLSPISLTTPSPLSPPDPYDVPLGVNQEETSRMGGPLDDRGSANTDLDSPSSSSKQSQANVEKGASTSSRISCLDGRKVAGLFNNGQNTTINGGSFYHVQGDLFNARGLSDPAARESTQRFPSGQYKAVSVQAQPSVSLPPAALLEILELLVTNIIRHLDAQARDSTVEDANERTSQDDDDI